MVTLDPLPADEFDRVAAWLAEPGVNQWLTGEWRDRTVNATVVAVAVRNRRNRFFLVRNDTEAVGLVALSDIEPADRTAMVWYALGRGDLGGKGITTRAVSELVRIAFGEMRLKSLYAWVMDGNLASKKVLQKAGFREAGRIRSASSFNGRQVDRVYFDQVPSDGVP